MKTKAVKPQEQLYIFPCSLKVTKDAENKGEGKKPLKNKQTNQITLQLEELPIICLPKQLSMPFPVLCSDK